LFFGGHFSDIFFFVGVCNLFFISLFLKKNLWGERFPTRISFQKDRYSTAIGLPISEKKKRHGRFDSTIEV